MCVTFALGDLAPDEIRLHGWHFALVWRVVVTYWGLFIAHNLFRAKKISTGGILDLIVGHHKGGSHEGVLLPQSRQEWLEFVYTAVFTSQALRFGRAKRNAIGKSQGSRSISYYKNMVDEVILRRYSEVSHDNLLRYCHGDIAMIVQREKLLLSDLSQRVLHDSAIIAYQYILEARADDARFSEQGGFKIPSIRW
jgi:hypothetical protein